MTSVDEDPKRLAEMYAQLLEERTKDALNKSGMAGGIAIKA
jgi:hypothetical protein